MTHRQLRLLAVAVASLGFGISSVSGQVTTQEAASIVVFPKVIVDASWETTIQLSNTANRPARAVCYYVDGGPTLPGPPGPANPPVWTQTDFSLFLVRQQPTQWIVSRGRDTNPSDPLCDRTVPVTNCPGAGLDPGRIPALGAEFAGELICYEIDASGAPWSGNAFTGQATLMHAGTGEVLKYSAIGIPGLQTNNADGTLCLGGDAGDECALGPEYDSCPREWIISHPADFDDRSLDRDAARTKLTIVPCGHDFDTQIPQRLILQFEVTTELETTFSAAANIECWGELALSEVGQVFSRDVVGSDWLETRVRSAASMPFGFMLIQETERETARPVRFLAAASPGHEGESAAVRDRIIVPEESVR